MAKESAPVGLLSKVLWAGIDLSPGEIELGRLESEGVTFMLSEILF